MDTNTKALIERRALQLAKKCEPVLLNEDDTDEIAGAGFRWSYLILRKPKRYLENFRYGNLMIDPTLLNDAFWQYQVEGPTGLLFEEKEILREHNEASLTWMNHNQSKICIVGRTYDHC
jgi:hypothetical protein